MMMITDDDDCPEATEARVHKRPEGRTWSCGCKIVLEPAVNPQHLSSCTQLLELYIQDFRTT